ncbi:S-layer family protein [Salsuginibacillus halophilus]|uniref:Autolysin n=1 Tax=Salsuginibacillus halophilus TaxID=517424 RepID=A0A2P8H506_9BACI|nr:N-acetylmuramoyl-L-alanine amidase [Salsuginibacillus halophilus]PSL41279.1 S-layer family protein [Salsuginibacillus halophilus]
MSRFTRFDAPAFAKWLRGAGIQRTVNHIQIHHTWRPRKTDYTGEATIRGMRDYHVNTNGWQDIAQHLSIAPDGGIWDGRSFELNPAGISNHNAGGVCIEIIGDFDDGEEVLEGAQLAAVTAAVRSLMDVFSLNESAIVFHNEHSGKTCPGSGITKPWFLQQLKEVDDITTQQTYTVTDFPDVPDDFYGAASVQAVKDLGLIKGHADGRFGFGEEITREELAVILHRFMQIAE